VLLAQHFAKVLGGEEEITPAMLNTIRQFLRDNNVNATKQQVPERIEKKVLPFPDPALPRPRVSIVLTRECECIYGLNYGLRSLFPPARVLP
jgi:hypothetical protein